MKLSTEFYDQLNSIENFNQLDYNDPQVVAVRMRADHELAAMEQRRLDLLSKPTVRKKKLLLYEFYEGRKVIASGTAEEVAKMLGIKSDSVRLMATASHHKRINKDKNRYSEKVGVVE